MNLPKERPLTVSDFTQLPKGSVLILHYNCVNKGTFVWQHDRVENNRVFGQWAYPPDSFTEIDDYLYEYQGYVCRGSGAEPIWAVMPQGRCGAEMPFINGKLVRNPFGEIKSPY